MRAAESSPLPSPPGDTRQRRPLVTFGPFAFDPHSRLLSRDGTEVPLPPRVLGVLELLLVRAGEVVNRQELIDTIWKDAFVTDTSLAEAVSVLRQALGDDSQAPTYIQTLHRRGYRFVAPVGPAAPPTTVAAQPPADAALDARVSPSIGKELVPWGVAAVTLCIAAAAIWQLTRANRGEPTITTRFSVAAAPGTTFDTSAPALAISRDGTRIAWSACDAPSASSAGACRLYVRSLDRLEPVTLSGVEGRAPFFSPDGRWLGYFAEGRLMKIALTGGAPTTIADAPTPLGGVWIDRDIIFAGSPSGGLQRVPADGGDVRTLTRPRETAGEIRHVWPAIVPGTRIVIFTIDTTLADAAAGAPGALAVLSLDTVDRNGEANGWRSLLGGASIASAVSSDAIVFGRDADLHAVSFDAARQAMSGTPRAIASNLATARGRAQFALSPAGTLVYAEDNGADRPLELTPAPATPSASAAWPYRAAALSPDGSRIAGVKIEDTRADIWIAETIRGAATRLTHTGANTAPAWAADGRMVYFAARSNGAYEIWRREANGAGEATSVYASARHAFPLAVSPDGSSLAFLQTADRTRADIWLLPLAGGPVRPVVEGPLDEGAASFSPDSTLLAFESAETGRWEIYVMRVGDGRRLLVSTSGGRRPIWTRDGLHYQAGASVVRVAIGAEGGELRVKDPSTVATIDGDLVGLTADGRYLVGRTSRSDVRQAIVNLDWLRELRALLGPVVAEPPR